MRSSAKRLTFSFLLMATSLGVAADPQQMVKLDDWEIFDRLYLNQTVTVKSPLPFDIARLDSGKYSPDLSTGKRESLSISYRDQKATVIAIQRPGKVESKANALGEIKESHYVGPIEVVIKCDDGRLAILTTTESGMETVLTLPSKVTANQNQRVMREKQAQAVIGKTVYAYSASTIYDIDTTIEDLDEQESLKRNRDLPYLSPLIIETARYIEHKVGSFDMDLSRYVLKLRSTTTGKQALASGFAGIGDPIDGSFLLTKMPSLFTLKEIEAIRDKSFFRGMSRKALEYSIGEAKRVNSWGVGGSQLVYSEDFIIFLDSNNRVANWQISSTH